MSEKDGVVEGVQKMVGKRAVELSSGLSVSVNVCSPLGLPKLTKLARGMAAQLGLSTLDQQSVKDTLGGNLREIDFILTLVEGLAVEVLDVLPYVCSLTRKEIEGLDGVDYYDLLKAVWELNGSFFIRLFPALPARN